VSGGAAGSGTDQPVPLQGVVRVVVSAQAAPARARGGLAGICALAAGPARLAEWPRKPSAWSGPGWGNLCVSGVARQELCAEEWPGCVRDWIR
jgi:hypothetical protein